MNDTLTRRGLLSRGAGLALAVTALGSGSALLTAACETKPTVRLGISQGSQTLWRYVVARGEELLASSGYRAEFKTYGTEAEVADALRKNEIDVLATVVSGLPQVRSVAGGDVRMFLPIAWLDEGYPIVVRQESPLQSTADLAGKRVAIFPAQHPATLFWRTLVQANYRVNLLDAWGARPSEQPEILLEDGGFDAAMTSSPALPSLLAAGYRQLTNLSREWVQQRTSDRLMLFGGYMARQSFITNFRPFAREFVRANRVALERYRADRSAFLAVVSDQIGGLPAISEPENASIAAYLGMNTVTPDRVALDDADVADMDVLLRLMREAGVIQENLTGSQALVRGSDLGV